MKKRILEIRKQSRNSLPKNDIWFFNEDSNTNQTSLLNKKMLKGKRFSSLDEEYRRNSLDYFGKANKKQDSLFVVDWQLSDDF